MFCAVGIKCSEWHLKILLARLTSLEGLARPARLGPKPGIGFKARARART